MTDKFDIFNRALVKRHRNRAAKELPAHNFLFLESAERLVDRLASVNRSFPLALDIGCHGGELAQCLADTGAIKTLIQTDLSPSMAHLAARFQTPAVACDEESLPFIASDFDLVLSNLSLHWTNDLPGTLIQIRRALKPDGLFMAALLGGETLNELRTALYLAETQLEGGLSPRFSPLIDLRDLGNLTTRTGFALPVVDRDTITVFYSDPLKLFRDLRGMGETNANRDLRRTFSRRATIERACNIYLETFANADGQIPATFEILTITAWAPSPNQQVPLKRGSAQARLADILENNETSSSNGKTPE